MIIDDFFEDAEYVQLVAAFKKAEYTVVHIGLKKGKIVTGFNLRCNG